MRPKVEVSKSIQLTELLFLISQGYNYAQKIHKKTKKEPSPIVQQLKKLHSLGFVNCKKEPILNKKVYSINWGKIILEFISHIKPKYYDTFHGSLVKKIDKKKHIIIQHPISGKKIRGTLSENDIKDLKSVYLESFFTHKMFKDSMFEKRIISNSYLLEIFQKIFSKINRRVSLNDLFTYLLDKQFFNSFYIGMRSTRQLIRQKKLGEKNEDSDFLAVLIACFEIEEDLFSRNFLDGISDDLTKKFKKRIG